MIFNLICLILFLWSIVSLIYALIKRHQEGIQAFVILVPNLGIMVSNIIRSWNFFYMFN
jgi:hypothetical protein